MHGMIARWLATVLAVALLPSVALASGKSPDRAVLALGKLSAAQLSLLEPRGAAFLEGMYPGHPEMCGPSSSEALDFDRSCMWSQENADDDFDILVGIENESIVSVVTPWPKALPGTLWTCEPFAAGQAPGDMMICSIASASAQKRGHWAQSWRTFLNSVG